MEHMRTENNSGTAFQWCDAELCVMMDRVTGELTRFNGNNTVGTLDRALDYLKSKKGWELRTVIVKLSCIAAFKINEN